MSINLLLVDDEPDFLEILSERLEARGYSVVSAASGEKALKSVAPGIFDVAILDVRMPGMDGITLLKEIKKIDPLTEAIMLTGAASVQTAVDGMKAGAFDYIMKPALITELVEKIDAAYRRKSEQEQRIRNAEQGIDTAKLASIGELAAGIAHEINNPVAIMVAEAGWIEDLLQDEELMKRENLEEFRRSLKQISAQGERCKEITHKLLSFARRTDPVRRSVQINGIIEAVLRIFDKRSKLAGIEVKRDLDPELPTLFASPSELEQVFVNLFNNAVDAMSPDGGVLGVRSRVEKEWIEVDVSDTGHGIDKSTLARIFDPFFTTKSVGKGTGLGLSICYGIVEKLGGNITVSSTVGQGATFRVSLPLAGKAS